MKYRDYLSKRAETVGKKKYLKAFLAFFYLAAIVILEYKLVTELHFSLIETTIFVLLFIVINSTAIAIAFIAITSFKYLIIKTKDT